MTATRLCARALIRLSCEGNGAEAADFLQGLVTQDVTGPLPVWAGLLTPQGKVLFDFIVWPGAGGLLLDCEADVADALARRLSIYRLRRPVVIAREEGLAVHWRPHTGDGAASDPRLPALGERWVAPLDPADDDAGGADGDCADGDCADGAWLAHRLGLGVAEGRTELGDGELLWLECNAADLNGVSFTKGCYVGQENTARMNWRQKVNRRLVVVPLALSDPARQRAAYPALGLAVDHRRVEDIAAAQKPAWMAAEG